MKNLLIILLTLTGLSASAQDKTTEIPSKQAQITTALYAAPEDKRDGAMVYGYGRDGNFTVLREGNNDLICLGDDPGKPGVSSACYFKALEPYMARGRELKAEGKSTVERREIRGKEIEAGTLTIPDKSMLFVFSAEEANRNPIDGTVKDGHLRYVIYTPFATTEETGLPDKPYAPGMPWLMDPGTHRAHIMVTPPR